jgi:hypothetical protein
VLYEKPVIFLPEINFRADQTSRETRKCRHVAAANQIRPCGLPCPRNGQQYCAVFTIRAGFGSVRGAQSCARGINPETRNPPWRAGCVGTRPGISSCGRHEIPGKSDREQVGKTLEPEPAAGDRPNRPSTGKARQWLMAQITSHRVPVSGYALLMLAAAENGNIIRGFEAGNVDKVLCLRSRLSVAIASKGPATRKRMLTGHAPSSSNGREHHGWEASRDRSTSCATGLAVTVRLLAAAFEDLAREVSATGARSRDVRAR